MLYDRFREGFIELYFGSEALGEPFEGLIHLCSVLFEFSFKVLLKVGNIFAHGGKDVFEVTLEFSSQTKFEFFTVHCGSPPNLEIRIRNEVGKDGGSV